MKIGFNTFADNPACPVGFPKEWPWQIVQVPEGDEATYSAGRVGTWILVDDLTALNAYKLQYIQAYEVYLTLLAGNTQKANAYNKVYQLLQDAEAWGRHIIRQYATQNTINGVDGKIIDVVLVRFVDAYIKDALETGSLKIARTRILALDEDEIVTPEVKAYFVNEINKFLTRPQI